MIFFQLNSERLSSQWLLSIQTTFLNQRGHYDVWWVSRWVHVRIWRPWVHSEGLSPGNVAAWEQILWLCFPGSSYSCASPQWPWKKNIRLNRNRYKFFVSMVKTSLSQNTDLSLSQSPRLVVVRWPEATIICWKYLLFITHQGNQKLGEIDQNNQQW